LEEKVRQRADSQKEVGRLKNEVTRGQLRCEELQEQLKKLEAENRSVRSKPLRHFFQSS
jgi:septal ring factor EnvC (AmiA/AmiB activator)